jgi:hypothetical protein
MKKYLLILALALGSIFSVKAQDDLPADANKRQEKIEALYVAYVTQQLSLTPDEAQKFWPLHTQFVNELKGVNKSLPELDKQQQFLNIKKKYQDGFNKILGTNRCERFYRIDGEFKRKLLERMNNRKMNNQQRPGFRRGQ